MEGKPGGGCQPCALMAVYVLFLATTRADGVLCDLWLSDSTVSGAGRGVFAGRAFAVGEVIAHARPLAVPRATSEATQLSNYVFTAPTAHPGRGPGGDADAQAGAEANETLLLLGVASLLNHGEMNKVNAALSVQLGELAEVYAKRDIRIGEELLVSYGTSEWFTDRGMTHRQQSDDDIPETNETGPVFNSQGDHDVCISNIAPARDGEGLRTRYRLQRGAKLVTPALLLPAVSVSSTGALAQAGLSEKGGLKDGVIVLPIGFPGYLPTASTSRHSPTSATCRLQLTAAGDVPDVSKGFPTAQELCDDAVGMGLFLELTLHQDLEAGHPLAVHCTGDILPTLWASTDVEALRLDQAQQGNLQAVYQQAQLIRLGAPGASGRAPDANAATFWYEKAAQSGHTAAQLRLGAAYHDGIGVTQNSTTAVWWYRAAAEQGSASAQFLMGLSLNNGDGIVKNQSEATQWFLKCAQQGSSNFAKAEKAMYNLAVAYREGIGLPPNISAAHEWFIKAAERGSVKAKYNLGVAYSRGEGVDLNHTRADEWYLQAAEEGHMMAQYNLAFDLAAGRGAGGMNSTSAAHWFSRAAEQGSADAQFILGLWYSQGRGVPLDLARGAALYHQAAKQGHREAQKKLALAYEHGLGVRLDYKMADHWLREAGVNDHQRRSLAYLWFTGEVRLGQLFGSWRHSPAEL